MQIVVTSYKRLKYLKQCVESIRQDNVQLFIADGGSDEETKEYIKQNADGFIFFEGNPGADFLKTEGIKAFVTDKEFIISSDDLVYPKGYSELILNQYKKLNADGLKWTFCACNMQSLEDEVKKYNNPALHSWKWEIVNGVEILKVVVSQVAGAILDLELCKFVGYFPAYGKSGYGDRAISKRLQALGINLCFFRNPMIDHIGRNKAIDFPEYSADFERDEAVWQDKAARDELKC